LCGGGVIKGNLKKFTWEETGVFGGNIEIIATFQVLVRIYFISAGQITPTTNRCS
jgi:hypothetical protein